MALQVLQVVLRGERDALYPMPDAARSDLIIPQLMCNDKRVNAFQKFTAVSEVFMRDKYEDIVLHI
jgi:hypothetical protein